MKKNFLALGTCAFALALGLAACGEDCSSNGPTNDHDFDYGEFTDARDGQVYKTVTIGTQTWMAENLNYDPGDVSSMGSYAWSGCYGNESSNCTKYGRLYTWEVAMDDASCGYGETCNASLNPSTPIRGVCPSGWHLPSHREFEELINYIDPSFGYNHTDGASSSTAGKYLKSNSGWNSSGNGTDAYGFSALPGGYRYGDGDFGNVGNDAYFWSSGEYNSRLAFYLYLNYDYEYYEYASLYRYDKDFARSVRCLKDSSPTSGEATSSSSQAQPLSSSSEVIPSSSSSVILSESEGSSSSVSYGTLTDLRDNQVYKTVTIGTQIWMAENLNYAYTGVKYNYSSYTSDSTSWCYDNKASNCDKYGRLYTWSAVMDSAAQFSVNAGTKCGYGKTCTPNSPHRGICPEGWHVPTNEEYSTLYTYIGGSSTAGSLFKSTSGWNDYKGKNGNGSDKYGFSVLPAGYRSYDGCFDDEGYYAALWSASEYNSYGAWYQGFRYDGDGASQYNYGKYNGRSLRCLRDKSDGDL